MIRLLYHLLHPFVEGERFSVGDVLEAGRAPSSPPYKYQRHTKYSKSEYSVCLFVFEYFVYSMAQK